MKKVMIPMINKVMPSLIVQDIIGVQPMGDLRSYFIQTTHQEDVPEGFVVVDVKWFCWEIKEWIEKQNPSKWKPSEDERSLVLHARYIISEDLYTILALKFSK